MTLALGVSHTPGGTQFAVTARDAERVELCIFEGKRETRQAMQRRDGVHIAVEEANLFPLAEMLLSRGDLAEISANMVQRRGNP